METQRNIEDFTFERKEYASDQLLLEIDGKEIQISYQSKNFEYPVDVQKESGILGYERKIIDEKNLKSIFDEVIIKEAEQQFGFTLTGIETVADFIELFENLKIACNTASDKHDKSVAFVEGKGIIFTTPEEDIEDLKSRDFNVMDIERIKRKEEANLRKPILKYIWQRMDKISWATMMELSKGDFPLKTVNHEFGFQLTNQPELLNTYKDQLLKDKVFLQRIFGSESISGMQDRDIPNTEVMNHHVDVVAGTYFTVIDKDTLEVVKVISAKDIPAYNNPEYLITSYSSSGLNVSSQLDQYSPEAKINNIFDNKIRFGFETEGAMKKYLLDTIILLDEINKKSGKLIFTPEHLYRIFILADTKDAFDRDTHVTEKESGKYVDRKNRRVYLEQLLKNLEHYAPFTTKLFYENINNEPIDEDSEFEISEHLSDRIFTSDGGHYYGRLPITINHPDVKQLQWGDAKYATYLSDKGLNFFQFHHKGDDLETVNSEI